MMIEREYDQERQEEESEESKESDEETRKIFTRPDGTPVGFYIHESVQSRTQRRILTKNIEKHGGKVLDTLVGADTVLTEKYYAARDILQLSFAVDDDERLRRIYVEPLTFVAKCMTRRFFGHAPRPVQGMGGVVGKKHRTPFTTDDDERLCHYLARTIPEKGAGGRTGNSIYEKLLELSTVRPVEFYWVHRHTPSAWRERYKKNFERFDPLIAEIAAREGLPEQPVWPQDRRLGAKRRHRRASEIESESEEIDINFPGEGETTLVPSAQGTGISAERQTHPPAGKRRRLKDPDDSGAEHTPHDVGNSSESISLSSEGLRASIQLRSSRPPSPTLVNPPPSQHRATTRIPSRQPVVRHQAPVVRSPVPAMNPTGGPTIKGYARRPVGILPTEGQARSVDNKPLNTSVQAITPKNPVVGPSVHPTGPIINLAPQRVSSQQVGTTHDAGRTRSQTKNRRPHASPPTSNDPQPRQPRKHKPDTTHQEQTGNRAGSTSVPQEQVRSQTSRRIDAPLTRSQPPNRRGARKSNQTLDTEAPYRNTRSRSRSVEPSVALNSQRPSKVISGPSHLNPLSEEGEHADISIPAANDESSVAQYLIAISNGATSFGEGDSNSSPMDSDDEQTHHDLNNTSHPRSKSPSYDIEFAPEEVLQNFLDAEGSRVARHSQPSAHQVYVAVPEMSWPSFHEAPKNTPPRNSTHTQQGRRGNSSVDSFPLDGTKASATKQRQEKEVNSTPYLPPEGTQAAKYRLRG